MMASDLPPGAFQTATNRTILYGVPTPPPHAENITTQPLKPVGKWVLGLNQIAAAYFPISPILRRKFAAQAEEFLLGLLSVVLIAVVSDILHAVLMHTRRRNAADSVAGLHTAVLVDEVVHFRNLWAHVPVSWSCASAEPVPTPPLPPYTSLSPHPPPVSRDGFEPASFDDFAAREPKLPPAPLSHPPPPASCPATTTTASRVLLQAGTSAKVLAVALGLLAFDVLAVYLTQPLKVRSRHFEYNVQARQPTFTEAGALKFAHRNSLFRPCTTPVFVDGQQQRDFSLSACLVETQHIDDEPTAYLFGNVSISSYFHEAGSDHFITFANSSVGLRTRAILYLPNATTLRLLFHTNDPDFRLTAFLHELVVHAMLERACDFDRRSSLTCAEKVAGTKATRQTRRLKLEKWRARRGPVSADVEGLVSTYIFPMAVRWAWVYGGTHVLSSTAVMEETQGAGAYIESQFEWRFNNIDALLSEEARVAGLTAFFVILAVMGVVLVVMRAVLRPLSLGAVAWHVGSMQQALAAVVEEDTARRRARGAPSSNGSGTCVGAETPNPSVLEEFYDSARFDLDRMASARERDRRVELVGSTQGNVESGLS